MANTIDRSKAEGIPRSANGATRDATWDATRDNRITGSGAASVGARGASLDIANPQSEGGGEVQITNTAAKLAALGQSLSASSPVDDARVARISQALADGSYRISAQQIAAGLMQSDHALGQIGL